MTANTFFLSFFWHSETNRWAYKSEDEIPEHSQDVISEVFHRMKDSLRIDYAVGGIAVNQQTKVETMFTICRKPKRKFLMIVKEFEHSLTPEEQERESKTMKTILKFSRLS